MQVPDKALAIQLIRESSLTRLTTEICHHTTDAPKRSRHAQVDRQLNPPLQACAGRAGTLGGGDP